MQKNFNTNRYHRRGGPFKFDIRSGRINNLDTHVSPHLDCPFSLLPTPPSVRVMPGGSVTVGEANASKTKPAGIFMVCPACSRLSLPSFCSIKTAFAAFGGILYGYDTGTIAGLQQMPYWLRTFGHPMPVSPAFPDGYGISSSQRSLVVSSVSAGTFLGLFNPPFFFRSH